MVSWIWLGDPFKDRHPTLQEAALTTSCYLAPTRVLTTCVSCRRRAAPLLPIACAQRYKCYSFAFIAVFRKMEHSPKNKNPCRYFVWNLSTLVYLSKNYYNLYLIDITEISLSVFYAIAKISPIVENIFRRQQWEKISLFKFHYSLFPD